MSKRVCLEPGCPILAERSRCDQHTRAKDAARGTRQARGYDAAHDRLRARWQVRLDQGEAVYCWRCRLRGVLTLIDAVAWHLGHDDQDRDVYRGPECVPCNTATSGRISSGA